MFYNKNMRGEGEGAFTLRGIKIFIRYPRNDIGNAEKIIKKCAI